jgi:hypothetical protein
LTELSRPEVIEGEVSHDRQLSHGASVPSFFHWLVGTKTIGARRRGSSPHLAEARGLLERIAWSLDTARPVVESAARRALIAAIHAAAAGVFETCVPDGPWQKLAYTDQLKSLFE